MYLLSVIVPVYNAEKYLDECLKHLVNMGDRVQIILADDGSTDNSYSICKSYAEKYGNIVLLSEENGGPSAARNLALAHAEGRYVVFCDSDDWLDEKIVAKLEEYESRDIDFFQFATNGSNDLLYDEEILLNENQKLELFSLIVGFKDNRNLGHGYFGLVTCKIFKRELIKDIKFDPQVVGEDTLYAVQAFKRIDTAVFLPYRFYYYRIIDGSYSRRLFPGIVPMALRMLERMRTEIPDCELMRIAMDCHAIDKFWWCFSATTDVKTDYKEVHERLKELYRIPEFYSAFQNKAVKASTTADKIKISLIRADMLNLLALLLSLRRRL